MPAPNLSLWRKLFRRKDVAVDLAEHVIEEQAYWERHHNIQYAPDQRFTALVQRARKVNQGNPPDACVKILKAAAWEWDTASKAAEETT